MNIFRNYFCILVIALTMFNCANKNTRVETSVTETSKFVFKLPEIPTMIVDRTERKNYLANHYWDKFNFTDSTLVQNDSLLGTTVAGYTQLLSMCDDAVITSSLSSTFNKSLNIGYDTFETLRKTLENYLYDPNSPMRNEELYYFVASYVVNNANLDEIYKTRAKYQLEMISKNQRGDLATDFEYTTVDGVTQRLYSLKSEYTILFFNDPDCNECDRVKQFIANSKVINNLYNNSKLKILAIYPENNLNAWKKSTYPKSIINSYDKDIFITHNKLYDLRALPTLYLLDKNKHTILKDSSIEKIESWLNELIN